LRHILAGTLLLATLSIAAQTTPHDITQVDTAPIGGAMAVPLPQAQQKRLRKYEIPELVGAKQALGSQLVDGRLPRPVLDYVVVDQNVEQRLSIFEKGLVVVRMSGAGGSTMLKRVILPDDALKSYLRSASPERLAAIRAQDVTAPGVRRRSLFRVYRDDGGHVELAFDPVGVIPKTLGDQIRPIEDLFRALSEDRAVTNTIADYIPAVGDELVSDDRKTWRVERVMRDLVELHCVGQPTIVYVDRKDLYNYFVGKRVAGNE